MKNKTLIFTTAFLLIFPSCNSGSFFDPWNEKEDEFPTIMPPKEMTEEEIIENEKLLKIERFEGLKYYLQDECYYIWGCYEKFESLTIPDTYKNKPVSGIYWNDPFSYTADTLTELRIGKNMKGISCLSLASNSRLTNIIIDDNNEYYQVIDNVLYLIKTGSDLYPCSLIWVLPNKTGELDILEGVGPFDNLSLKYADKVTSIHLPNSMPNPIDNRDYAIPNFSFCSSLLKFEINQDNQNYQVLDGVLYSKNYRDIISYPAGKRSNYVMLEQIENIFLTAFYGSVIPELTINKKISNFKAYWLINTECDSIICNPDNDHYTSFDGCLYSKDMTNLLYVPNGKEKIDIYNGTEKITNLSNDNIEYLKIPDNVAYIEYVFLPNLESLILGSGIKEIKAMAFYWTKPIKNTFYNGTTTDLKRIKIENGNPSLIHSNRYFYSEKKPNKEGNYWHYIDNKPTIW